MFPTPAFGACGGDQEEQAAAVNKLLGLVGRDWLDEWQRRLEAWGYRVLGEGLYPWIYPQRLTGCNETARTTPDNKKAGTPCLMRDSGFLWPLRGHLMVEVGGAICAHLQPIESKRYLASKRCKFSYL